MRKGTMAFDAPSMIKVLIISLVLLIIGLTFIGKWGVLGGSYVDDLRCMQSISAMGKGVGEGIRCPTEKREYEPGKQRAQEFLAHELARCARRMGTFESDPFRSHATNICLICSTVDMGKETADVDTAVVTDAKGTYVLLTGRSPTANLRDVVRMVPDAFTDELAVVWIWSSRTRIEDFLVDWGMTRTGELWHGGLLELIPDENVEGEESIIGAGRGIFSPEGEGLNQAVLLRSTRGAKAQGCVTLNDHPFKPPA